MTAISLSGYARHRRAAGLAGGTLRSVQEAIAAGRLDKALTPDRRQVADAAAADAEWAGSTYADRIPISGPGSVGSSSGGSDLLVARTRREAALARLAELDVGEREGQLIDVDQARADVINRFAIVRTRLLGIPSRVAQRLPHVAAEVVPVLDDLLREALEELASSDGVEP